MEEEGNTREAPPLPPQPAKQQKKPPDTMIRELKSKLKQRQIRTANAAVSPKNDRKKSNNLLEVYESSIFDEEEDDVTGDLPSPPPPSAVTESAKATSRAASSADTRHSQMPRSE